MEVLCTLQGTSKEAWVPLSATEGGVMCSWVGHQKELCFFSELGATGEGIGQKNDLI